MPGGLRHPREAVFAQEEQKHVIINMHLSGQNQEPEQSCGDDSTRYAEGLASIFKKT